MKVTKELCGIEFPSEKELERFLVRNPQMHDTTMLSAGEWRILVFLCADFPTRECSEIFSPAGKHLATFIGPDALEYTYQIKLGAPGEPGGYRPEAFR
jgi:hypothetical protein